MPDGAVEGCVAPDEARCQAWLSRLGVASGPQDEEMKTAKPGPDGASQPISSVRPTHEGVRPWCRERQHRAPYRRGHRRSPR